MINLVSRIFNVQSSELGCGEVDKQGNPPLACLLALVGKCAPPLSGFFFIIKTTPPRMQSIVSLIVSHHVHVVARVPLLGLRPHANMDRVSLNSVAWNAFINVDG